MCRALPLALLVLSCGSPTDQPPVDQPAVAEPVGEEPVREAPEESAPATPPVAEGEPALVEEEPPPPPETSEQERLEQQVLHLRELLDGELPARIDVQTLFEVALGDEEAVAARVAELAGEPDPSSTPDAGPVDAGPVDAGPASADGESSDGDGTDGEAPDTQGADGEPQAETDPRPPLDDAALAALRARRDALRLRFLRMPAERRREVLERAELRRELAVTEIEEDAALRRAQVDEQRATVERQEAIDRSAETATAAEQALRSEHARIWDGLLRLAQRTTRLAEEQRDRTRLAATLLDLEHQVRQRIDAGDPEGADAAYDEVSATLDRAREALAVGLQRLRDTPTANESLRPQIALQDPAYEAHPELLERIESALAEYADAVAAAAEERRVRWPSVRTLAERVRELELHRIELLTLLQPTVRDAQLGLGEAGRAQLRREARQAELMIRVEGERLARDMPEAPRAIAAWLTVGSSRGTLLWLLAVGLGLVALWRGRRRVVRRAEWLLRGGQLRAWWALAPWWPFVSALLEPLMTWAGFAYAWHLAASLGHSAWLDAAGGVAVVLSGIRVAWTFGRELVSSRVRSGALPRHREAAVQSELGRVLRWLAVVGVVRALAIPLVGRGTLFGWIAWLTTWATVALLVWVLYRWAPVTSIAYRERYPSSTLADALGPEAGRFAWLLAVPAASARLLVDGGVSVGRQVALQFEGTRRALAFLLRRRLEQQSRERPDRPAKPDLPETLAAALDANREELSVAERVPHYPLLPPVVESAKRFRDGERGTAVAVVGERGAGKSTWVRELLRQAGLDAEVKVVPNEIGDRAATCRWLCRALGLDEVDDLDALDEALPGDARRVVVLEDTQNLILRAVGGTEAISTLVEAIGRTCDRVLWVATFTRLTWRYLERARQSESLFEQVVELVGWPEDQIAELIRRRARVAGYAVSYAGLVVEELAGSAFDNAVVRSREEFYQLLWEYSAGNPRVALHFFGRAVASAADGVVRIQLFDTPNGDQLEALHDQSRFLLAAIALHDNLTVSEAAHVTTYPRSDVAAIFALLVGRGVIEEHGEGRFRLGIHWYRTALRFLRRKQLIF